MNTSSVVSKIDYLKRYISGDDVVKKKRKKKKIVANVLKGNLTVIDKSLQKINDNENEIDDDDIIAIEETPQIVAVIDDRPEEVKVQERLATGKWRRLADSMPDIKQEPIHDDDNINNIKIKEEPVDTDDLKNENINLKSDEIALDRHDSSDDDLPDDNKSVDISPPRKRKSNNLKNDDDDMSPPRKREMRKSIIDDDGDLSPRNRMKKTLSGTVAGLSSAHEMRKEMEKKKKRDRKEFDKIDDSVLGKNATTVFRDKTGRKRDIKKEIDPKLKEKEEELKKKYELWNKGISQKKTQENNIANAIHESNKPVARYENDEDLEKHLKEQERDGDPMLAFMKKKKHKKKIKNNEPIRPQYQGPPPPANRFGILPGYRWDGVNRSNGFETDLFKRASNKTAIAELSYKWSTEDM